MPNSTKVNVKPSGQFSTKTSFWEKMDKKIEKPFYSLLSIAIGFGVAFILILIIGGNPLLYVSNIFKGNFYSLEAFGNFLATLSWMILVGLAVAISFKAGLFNIGVAGQMMAGGIAGFFWAYYVDIGRAGVIFSILIPMFMGALIAWTIGFLKVRFKVNEVLSSIMINWIIYWFYRYFTNPSYFNYVDTSSGSTYPINDANSLQAGWLNNIFGEYSFINIGIIIAIVALVIIVIMYSFTTWGSKQNMLGSNKNAAKYVGLNEGREIIKTMTLSGALAGLAGSVYYLGIKNSLPALGSDIPGEAFNGITISLIAFNNPFGVLFSSIFVAMLYNSKLMVSSSLNSHVSTLILGIIVLVISLSQFMIIYKPIEKIANKWNMRNRGGPITEVDKDGDGPPSNSTIDTEKSLPVEDTKVTQLFKKENDLSNDVTFENLEDVSERVDSNGKIQQQEIKLETEFKELISSLTEDLDEFVRQIEKGEI